LGASFQDVHERTILFVSGLNVQSSWRSWRRCNTKGATFGVYVALGHAPQASKEICTQTATEACTIGEMDSSPWSLPEHGYADDSIQTSSLPTYGFKGRRTACSEWKSSKGCMQPAAVCRSLRRSVSDESLTIWHSRRKQCVILSTVRRQVSRAAAAANSGVALAGTGNLACQHADADHGESLTVFGREDAYDIGVDSDAEMPDESVPRTLLHMPSLFLPSVLP